MKGHFWFSEKQLDFMMRKRGNKYQRKYAKINGQIVEYTMWTDTKEHTAMWNDVVYLGEGEYDHSDTRH